MATLNLTYNETEITRHKWEMSVGAKIVLYTLYAVIFLVGTCGNVATMYIIAGRRRRTHPGDQMIGWLALTDSLASVAIPLVMVNDLASDLEWHFGLVMCKILPSLTGVFLMGSAWILVAIAYERMRAIKWPFKNRLSTRFVAITIVAVYTWSAVLVAPYSYHLQLVGREPVVCWDVWGSNTQVLTYFVIFNSCFSLLPSTIIFFMYGLGLQQLRKETQRQSKRSVRNRRRLEQDRNVTQMFLVIILVFFVLTTPYAVFQTLFTYWTAYETEYFAQHEDAFMSLNYAIFTASAFNSCVNPLIYAKMHRKISRRAHIWWASFVRRRQSARRATADYTAGSLKDILDGSLDALDVEPSPML